MICRCHYFADSFNFSVSTMHLMRKYFASVMIFVSACFLLDIYCRIKMSSLPDGPKKSLKKTGAPHIENCTTQTYVSTIWRRNSLLRQKCSLAKHRKNITNVNFFHWKNLIYCKVPKCGSTFWMQVFIALNKVKGVGDIFGKMRSLHHSSSLNVISNWNHVTGYDIIFHVTRNPYSRLYSAYVDKIYLPGFMGISKSINKRNKKLCNQSVSFGEFLDYIFKENLQDPHWQPISDLCGSCIVPYNVISKQESFNKDVRFILDRLTMSEHLKQEFIKNLKAKHTENSIKEITKVMISFAKTEPCLTFHQFCQRLWKSFQIQGYISDLVSFPANKFKSLNYDNVSIIVRKYLKGTKKIVMNGVMKKLQRQKYLNQAYNAISHKTLEDLKKMYKNDFDIYGYSYELPKEL